MSGETNVNFKIPGFEMAVEQQGKQRQPAGGRDKTPA